MAAKSNHNESTYQESKGEMLTPETLVEQRRMFLYKGMSCGRESRGQECSVKRSLCAPSFGGRRQMNRGFQKGLSESQRRRFVLASSGVAWKDYSPLRRKLVVWGGGGCHFSRGAGKPRKKYSDVGVRCDSQVLRVWVSSPLMEGIQQERC